MKKRNPNDTTMRNIRALKTRVKRLEELCRWLVSVSPIKRKGAK